MKADPQVIELDEGDLNAKLDQIEAVLGAEIAKPFRQLLAAYIMVLGVLRDKKLSLQRLRKPDAQPRHSDARAGAKRKDQESTAATG